jgi:transcriptional regulator with XRE-family HTH domain
VPRARTITEAWSAFAQEVGANIQRRRLELGRSQDRVAYESGISRYSYQKLEKGESRPGTPANPTLQTLIAISQALELELSDLLPREVPDLRGR